MFAALVSNGVVTDAIVTDDLPDGWIASEGRIGVGWTWDGATFAPPPPPPPPSPAQLEAEVQEIVDGLVDGALRDKAIVLLIADVIAAAFNVSDQVARTQARTRLVDHLRDLKGI